MTVFGADFSHFNWPHGAMDFASMTRAGMAFATHKCTEGASYRDPRWPDFCDRAHGTVPLPGAYHVLHSGNINAQVDNFLGYLGTHAPRWQQGPFIVQLDCERWPQDFPSPGDIEAWCDRFKAVTGSTHEVVVYASAGQYGDRVGGSCPLWNARYPSASSADFRNLYPGDQGSGWGAYSGRTPAIWQFSSNARVGSQPQCDANAFRGSLDQLAALTLTNSGGFDMAVEQDVSALRTWMTWLVNLSPESKFPIVAAVLQLQQAAAASAQREQAMLAAVQALSQSGTSVDTAVVVAAVNAAGDRESAALAAAQQQIAALTARLTAAGHALGG